MPQKIGDPSTSGALGDDLGPPMPRAGPPEKFGNLILVVL